MSEINWTMLPWQLTVWNHPARFKVVVCGRRTGKSNLAIKKTIAEALQAPKGSAVLYLAPTMAQARQIAFEAILDQARDFIKNSNVNQGDITLTNGIKIHVRSAENPDSLRGLKLAYATLDESAFIKEDVWSKVVRPALADLKGQAMFISTPDGRNWIYDLFQLGQSGADPDWASFHYTTLDNPTIDPAEIEAARKTLSSWSFKVEFEASFDTSGSGIFKEEWIKTGAEPEDGSYYIAFDLAGFADVSSANTAAKRRLDKTAIAVVKVTNDGKWWVKKIETGRWGVEETAQRLLKNVREYQPIGVGAERGALKNAVLPYLQDLMRKNNTFFSVQDLTHGNKKKTDRITWALQGRFEHGNIILNEEEDWEDLKEELLLFGAKDIHDDLVDALSYVDQMAISIYNDEPEIDDWQPFDAWSGY